MSSQGPCPTLGTREWLCIYEGWLGVLGKGQPPPGLAWAFFLPPNQPHSTLFIFVTIGHFGPFFFQLSRIWISFQCLENSLLYGQILPSTKDAGNMRLGFQPPLQLEHRHVTWLGQSDTPSWTSGEFILSASRGSRSMQVMSPCSESSMAPYCP